MFILITYDVSTEDKAGESRLRKVAKQCVNYGSRVQNSVFECTVDTYQLRVLKEKILKIIDLEKDSVRIYHLNEKSEKSVELYGIRKGVDIKKDLIF